MSPLKQNQALDAKAVDSGWKGLCRIGGVAAWMQLVCLLIAFFVLSTFGGRPNAADECFTIIQNNRLVGLLQLDFSSTVLLALFAVMFFGIYAALRRTSGAYAAFATALVFLGVSICLATDSGFSMLYLSDQYAAATTDAQRALFLAAGEAILASDMWHSTAGFMAGILLQGSAVFISVVMLRSKQFSRITVYAGILASGFDLVQHLIRPFAPSISDVIMMAAGPFYLIWYPLLGRDLIKLGK